jgi:hypothetical protein
LPSAFHILLYLKISESQYTCIIQYSDVAGIVGSLL